MNTTLKNLRAQEENLNGQSQDYTHLEQRYASNIREAEQNTQLLQTEVSNLNSEIARKQSELENVTHLCNTENELFKSGTQRMQLIKADLDLAVSHAISLVK